MSRKHSCMTTPPRSRWCVPHLPLMPGLRTRSRRSRVSEKPMNQTLRRQSVVRGMRRDGCMGAIGRPARSLAAKCQTNLVLSVRSAIFPGGETERQRSVASGKWPCSRLLLMSWPGGASRPTTVSSATGGASRRIAVYCPCEASRATTGPLVGRSLATIGVLLFRGRTTFSDCLASLRPLESRRVGMERVQSWRVSHRARAEQCRHLARGEWFGACAWPRLSASVGSVKPGCLSFPVEERSDEQLMPDTAPKIIRQPEWLECAKDIR